MVAALDFEAEDFLGGMTRDRVKDRETEVEKDGAKRQPPRQIYRKFNRRAKRGSRSVTRQNIHACRSNKANMGKMVRSAPKKQSH